LALIDWIDLNDQAMFNELERWSALKAFVYDAKVQGGEKEIDDWLNRNPYIREGIPPKPGSWNVHNDKVDIQAVSPDLKAADGTVMADMIRKYIMSGAGYWEGIMGYGDTTNVGEAREIMESVVWMFEHQQNVFKQFVTICCALRVQEAQRAGMMTSKGRITESDDLTFKVKFNEVLARKFISQATGFQQVTAALTVGINSEFIGKKLARRIAAHSLNDMGFEVNESEIEEEFEGQDNFPGLTPVNGQVKQTEMVF